MGKAPLTEHGYKDATSDAGIIDLWWQERPDANIGLACALSGILALDADPHRFDDNGRALLDRIVADFHTTTAQTPTDGYHFLYRLPADVELSNSPRSLPAGFDVRVAGYVVLAPSVVAYRGDDAFAKGVADGFQGRYRWLQGRDPYHLPPQPLPADLLDLLRPPERARIAVAAPSANGTGNSAYAQAALTRELDALAQTAIGGRNNRLNVAAFSLAQLVAGGELAEDEVRTRLLDVAVAIGLGEGEATRTVESGLAAGMLKPRGAPPWEEPMITYGTDAAGPAVDGAETAHATYPFLHDVPAEIVLKWFEDWRQASATEGGRTYPAWDFIARFADCPTRDDSIPGLLPRGEVLTISGKAGTGKSWLHARLAVEVAVGGPVLGRHQSDSGTVLCCLTEGKSGWAKRLRSHLELFGAGPDACAVYVRDNLPQLIEPRGYGTKVAGGLEWYLHIRRDQYLRTIPQTLRLILVDYLREASLGAVENSNDDMALVMRAANQLARALDAGVVLFHHQGADEAKAGRGATVVRDMSYAVAVMAGDLNKGEAEPVKLEFDKPPKDIPAPAPVHMTLDTARDGYPIVVYVEKQESVLADQVYDLLRYEFPGHRFLPSALARELNPPEGMAESAWVERVRRACTVMRKDRVKYPGIDYTPGRSGGYVYAG
jgi:hypothetical protein